MDELCNQSNGIQILRVGLMRLDLYAESFFHEQYKLNRYNRIQHAPCYKGRRLRQFVRILARKEFLENELVYSRLYFLGHFIAPIVG